MPVYGWDASDFDWARGPMDLAAAVRDGIAFFTHKATEGTRVVHTHYAEALNRARAAGIEFVGAYVVPRTPGNGGHGSVHAQVDYFLRYLDSQTPWWRTWPGFMLQVDTEKWGYDNVGPDVGAAMCAELAKHVDTFRIHYAPAWAYGNSIPGSEPLWASGYGNNPAVHYLEAYRLGGGDNHPGWRGYSGRVPAVLQYGSRTRIGVQPTCDANAFRGSIEEFRAMVTGGREMALRDDPDFYALMYRVKSIVDASDTIEDSAVKGDPNRLAQLLKAGATPLSAEQLAELKAAVVAQVPTADDVAKALIAQFQKPAV